MSSVRFSLEGIGAEGAILAGMVLVGSINGGQAPIWPATLRGRAATFLRVRRGLDSSCCTGHFLQMESVPVVGEFL